MAGYFAGALGAILGVVGIVSATVQVAPDERATRRAEYRRPAAIPFPADNPYSPAKAELGRSLFFDPILSDSGERSCGSCHSPELGWSDGRSRGAKRGHGDLPTRTPTLLNVAWKEGPLGWDGRFPDLERVAFTPITATDNMNLPEAEVVARLAADPDYASAFSEAFPESAAAVTREQVEAALATFERLIVSARSPFDRWVEGDEAAVGPAAQRGFDLFTGKANCAACHSGWTLTDGSFHDIGVGRENDVGRARFFPGSKGLRYAFKTPTLRNVARRAPYMHDGSLATLAEVIALYDRGGIERPSRSRDIRPLGLTPAEKADLLAFLETLNEPSPDPPALATLTVSPPRP